MDQRTLSIGIFLVFVQLYTPLLVKGLPVPELGNGSDINGEDKSYDNYNLELFKKYEYKDFYRAIFEDEGNREGFVKHINSHLTDQVRKDLRAVRVYRSISGSDMSVIDFNSKMDLWLGVLPQWKRVKKFVFGQMESYVEEHPEILLNATKISRARVE